MPVSPPAVLPPAPVVEEAAWPTGPGSYAAIAYSRSTGSVGYSWNWPTADGAKRAALQQCDAPDARVVGGAWNGHYSALAVGADGICGCAGGATEEEARELALRECQKWTTDCRVVRCVYSGVARTAGPGWDDSRCSRCGGHGASPGRPLCPGCAADARR